jgi:hypothetical protein
MADLIMKKSVNSLFLALLLLLSSSNSSANTLATQITLNDLKPQASETNAHHFEHFELELTQSVTTDISVDYYTRYGTAIPGQDYIPASDTVIIPKGETKVLISVYVLGDISLESNETFEMVLSNPSANIFPEGQIEIATTHTIINDDAPRNIDNTQIIAKNLSKTLIAGIPPILSVQTLLNQPATLANAFALNLSNLTLACPSGGTFTYTFTDSNSDLKYASIDDNLAINVNQCRNTNITTNTDITIDGAYNLKISGVTATSTETDVTLNNLLINDALSNTTSLFSGLLHTIEIDPDTVDNTLLTINSNNLQLSQAGIAYTFTNINTQVSTDIVSSEIAIQNYDSTLILSNSSNDGVYSTAIIEALTKRPTEKYPYAGKFSIQRQDGSMNITVTALNTTYVLIETDTNNDAVRDYSQVVAWNQLSNGF